MAKSHANAAQLRQVLRLFALFGHPIRVIIFQRISRAPGTAGELAKHLPVSRTAIVQHLKLLESAGLVSAGVRSASARLPDPTQGSGADRQVARSVRCELVRLVARALVDARRLAPHAAHFPAIVEHRAVAILDVPFVRAFLQYVPVLRVLGSPGDAKHQLLAAAGHESRVHVVLEDLQDAVFARLADLSRVLGRGAT
jgi:DNA-binding transcriptional ArsR family regulator